MATDDIFASLGGSLIRDLMSDINKSAAGDGDLTDDDDMLANLERELAAFTSDSTDFTSFLPPPGVEDGSGGAIAPPPPPPGLSTPSAASLVVSHSIERSAQLQTTPAFGIETTEEDAWSQSLSKFSALSLAEDFLKADSEKKARRQQEQHLTKQQSTTESEQNRRASDAVARLFEGEEEEYDLNEEVRIGNLPSPPGLIPLPQKAESTNADAAAAALTPMDDSARKRMQQQDTARNLLFALQHGTATTEEPERTVPMSAQLPAPPPNMGGQEEPVLGSSPPPAGSMPPPPSFHTVNMMQAGAGGPAMSGSMPPGFTPRPVPSGVMPPPGTVMMPPHLPPHVGGMHPIPGLDGQFVPGPGMGMHVPTQHMGPGMVVFPPPQQLPPAPSQQHGKARDRPMDVESTFKKRDFPALGSESKKEQDNHISKSDEEKEENDGDTPLFPTVRPVAMLSSTGEPTRSRVTFNDPSPRAPPIPAILVQTSLMPPRDLCYVIHSMLRPLQSLDKYNDDYYYWSYMDRQSRNILLLGPMGSVMGGSNTGSGGEDLPSPVWKEVKLKAKEMEDSYNKKVEERAKEWMEDKGVLGHVVKTNVKRPRALLSTPVLSKRDEEKGTEGADTASKADEDRTRVNLWKARIGIDRGYSAYLNLVELRRLLHGQNMGGGGEVEGEENRRMELMRDVNENIGLLHSAMGIRRATDGTGKEFIVDEKILKGILSLPKGRMLLSRAIYGGILPHPSACGVLPSVIALLFRSSTGTGGAPPPGEDGLLRALIGLVRTTDPSLTSRNVLDCLDAVIKLNDEQGDSVGGLRRMLGSRTRLELLHAILLRGGAICNNGEDAEEWREKERRFMLMVQEQQQSSA